MVPSILSLATVALAVFSVAASPVENAIIEELARTSILEKRWDFHFRYCAYLVHVLGSLANFSLDSNGGCVHYSNGTSPVGADAP